MEDDNFFWFFLFIGCHVIPSVNRIIIKRDRRDKLGSVISCDLNLHMDKSKADNSPIIVTTGKRKSILPFLHTDYTHSSLTIITIAINKSYMGPSVAEFLIETSGDNFLEEQSEWRWTGMPITSDPKSGLCWHESWPVVTFRALYRPSVVFSHMGLSLMSIGAFSHGPAGQDLSRPEERRGLEATWGEVRPHWRLPTTQLFLLPLRHL